MLCIKMRNLKIGNNKVGRAYPEDVLYNVCQIKDKVIGSKYADSSIKVDIAVKQGYTRCSIAVTSDNSCITTDVGIAKNLIKNGIDALYVKEDNIKLLKNSVLHGGRYEESFSEKNGFIGGATLCFDDKFVVFGDSNNLSNKDEIIKHLEKYNLKLVDFKGLPIIDYGSGIIF